MSWPACMALKIDSMIDGLHGLHGLHGYTMKLRSYLPEIVM